MLSKEQDAFIDKLFREMYNKMLSYAQYVLRDPSLSEEAIQDTFRIACAKINVICISKNPEGWLVNTLRNVIRNMQKSRITLNKYIVMLLDVEKTEAPIGAYETDYELLFGDIAKSEDFKLLLRVVIDKCTMLEASKELGITVEACKKRVQRIKKKIKEELHRDM